MEQRLDHAVESGTIQPPETAVESLTMQRSSIYYKETKVCLVGASLYV